MGEPPLITAVREEDKSIVELIVAIANDLPKPQGIDSILKFRFSFDQKSNKVLKLGTNNSRVFPCLPQRTF